MYQRIRCRYKFSELKYFISGKKYFLPFLMLLCLSLMPVLVHADCTLTSGSWHCTSEGECGDKLSGMSGQGIWDYNYAGADCKCWWHTCYDYPCPYVECACCSYDIPSCPSPSDPCCGNPDPCCGTKDPCCGNPDICCKDQPGNAGP